MRLSGRAAVGILMIAACPAGQAQDQAPDDIRDIRAPKSALAQAPLLPAVATGVVVLGLAAYAAWRWQRRRPGAGAMMPFEIALHDLEQARSLMLPASGREFGGTVSDIVRRYVEVQFSVTATKRTSQEFLQALLMSSGTPLARHRSLFDDFLQQSDLIKFAGGAVTVQALESLFQSATRLVRQTVQTETDNAPIPAT